MPRRILAEVRARYPSLDAVRSGHELMRRQITQMVEDVIATTSGNLDAIRPGSVDEVRSAGRTIATFSAELGPEEKELKAFLFTNMYRHPEIVRVRIEADRIVRELFDAYYADPAPCPRAGERGSTARSRVSERGMSPTFWPA